MEQELNMMTQSADNELLSLGENKVAYIAMITDDILSQVALNADMMSDNNDLWGVYSASGELLVVCDSPISAWEFTNENELVPVRTH